MGRSRAKASRKNTAENGKGVDSSDTISDKSSNATRCYVIRKVKKPAVSTRSLLSVPDLAEGITIVYSKNENIPKILQQANPTFNKKCVEMICQKLDLLRKTFEEGSIVSVVDSMTQGHYIFDCLCLICGKNQRVSGLRLLPPKYSKNLEKRILFVADDVSKENIAVLSESNHSQHRLRFEDGVLRWTESSGNMEVIRAHVDDADETSHVLNNISDLEERMVLLSAGHGTGKTTLMKRLVDRAKQHQPHLMVLSISLGNLAGLCDSGVFNQPLDFLKAAARIESPSQLLSFESALDDGNVVVLFDGLEELPRRYWEDCHILFAGLLKTNIKTLWIIVGKGTKKYFEERLSTFAMTLCEISNDDQRNILKHFWETLAKNEPNPEPINDIVVERLLEIMSQSISDGNRDFLGFPLRAQMMAEVFQDLVIDSAEFSELPEKMDLLDLFDRYTDRKCSVFVQDKVSLDPLNTDSEFISRVWRKNHEIAGLQATFSDVNYKKIHPGEDIETFRAFVKSVESGQEKTGMIERCVNGEPNFSHVVFGEYFAARWFANCTTRITDIVKQFIMPRFERVRFFFDRILAKDCDLHMAVLNENLQRVRSLLGNGSDVNARDLGGRTALHLAAVLGTSPDQRVTDRRNEILDLLIASTTDFHQKDDLLKGTPVQYADANESWTAMDKLLARITHAQRLAVPLRRIKNQSLLNYIVDHDLGRLMAFCFDNGFVLRSTHDVAKRLLPRSCKLGSVRVAKILVENGANIGMTYGEGDTPLHIASDYGHLEIVRLLVNAYKSAQTLVETVLRVARSKSASKSLGPTKAGLGANPYVDWEDARGDAALDRAARSGHLNVVAYLLLEKAKPGYPAMHNAIYNSKFDARVVDVVLKAIPMSMRARAINQISADCKSNCVHWAGMTGNVETTRLLLAAGGSESKPNRLGRALLQIAAWWGHTELVEFLVGRSPRDRRSELVNVGMSSGDSALECAVHNGHADVAAYLLRHGADKRSDLSLLTFAAGNCKADAALVRMALAEIPKADRERCVNRSCADGSTAMQRAALRGNVGGLELLIAAGGRVTLTKENPFSKSLLMEATIQGHTDVVQLLVKTLKTKCTNVFEHLDFATELLEVFRMAIFAGRVNVVKYLITENYVLGDLSELLRFAVENKMRNAEVLEIALSLIPAAVRASHINVADAKGNSSMHYAAEVGILQIVVSLVENGGKISAANASKETPLMMVAAAGCLSVVKYLLDKFDEEKEGMRKLDYIITCNVSGENAIHLATENAHDAVVALLVKVLDEQLADLRKLLGN